MKKVKTKMLCLGIVATAMSFSMAIHAQEFLSVAGCTDSNLIEGGALNKIAVSGTSYTPKCLKVKVGSVVEIDASRRHPLSAMPDIANAINPFSNGKAFSTVQSRTMSAPGVYGYFCEAHGDSEGDGMAGAIVVIP